MRACSICTSDQQAAIDAALVSGQSARSIAARFHVARTSLRRHNQGHLSPALIVRARQTVLGDGSPVLDRLEALATRAQDCLTAAVDGNTVNLTTGLAAIREARATLELIARITRELDERPQVVNVLVDPMFIRAVGTITTALRPFPEAQLAVADALRRLDGPS